MKAEAMQQMPTIPYQPPEYSPMPPENGSPNYSPQPPNQGPSRFEGLKSALSTILILVTAPLIALLIINFVFQTYEVDGPSMQPTLQNRDRLIVLKFPKSVARIKHKNYIPERGTIIVFAKKGMVDFGEQQEKQLIKRVVALPGERVVVEEGQVTVFNGDHPEGFNPDSGEYYPAMTTQTSGRVDLIVGMDEVFVLGDNRNNSLDSRTFGAISQEEIVGKLALRILPLNQAESF